MIEVSKKGKGLKLLIIEHKFITETDSIKLITILPGRLTI